MYNLLLSVWALNCAAYNKKEKQTLENYILFVVLAVCTTFLFQFSSLEVLDVSSFVLHIRV